MDYIKFDNLSIVVDGDYVINNHNSASEAIFPEVKDGVHCYKAIRGLDAPCPDCPIFLGGAKGRVIYDSPNKDKSFFATFSNIKFNNGTDGYIVTSSEIDPEKEKRDAEIQHYKHKIDILHRANYYCAFGYFDFNVTKDVITSDVYEVVDEIEYVVDMAKRGFKKPIRFSDYVKWFHDFKAVSNREEYREMTDREKLIEKFNNGECTFDLTFRTRSTAGYLTWHRHSIYLYQIEGSDDIFGVYVLRDIAFKFINDENSRRNEDIVRTLADEYAIVLYVDIANEVVSFSNLPPHTDPLFKKAVQDCNYIELIKLYVDRKVMREDADEILKLTDKDYLIDYFKSKKSLSITYREKTENNFRYYEMKIVKSSEGNESEPRTFVVGIANKDAEIRAKQATQKELESALILAQNDVLTGVRNRTGYDIYERQLNADIESGKVKEFAIIMFDVNRLKKTNDIEGHDKGDQMLKNASKLICDVFKHSSVFRTGGDEFVAILCSDDYDNRDELLKELRRKVEENEDKDGPAYENVSMASGMALYDPKIDSYVDDVLRRADDLMYENKSMMKIRRRERQRQKDNL